MKVYNLDEITSSTILYKRNPPKFMFYIIIIVLLLLVVFLAWSCYSVKTFIVKGQGIVSRENKVNVMAKLSGEIKEVYVEEGQEVKAGDVLLVFNSIESDLQINQSEEQIKYLNRRIELLKRAEQEMTKGINTFNIKNQEEKDFYNRIRSYQLKTKDYVIDEKSMKEQGYTDAQIADYKKQGANKIESLRYETIVSFGNERINLEAEKSRLEVQKGALYKSLNEYKLFAPADGVVHLNIPLNAGMVLQGGNLLGTISNEEDDLIIDAMVPSIDRPRIMKDAEVSLAVGGLNQVEYGTLTGVVIGIESDATINQENGEAYFKVKMKPNQSYLEDRKGQKVNIIEGMVTETRVTYEKVTYMEYFLEQIGIRFN